MTTTTATAITATDAANTDDVQNILRIMADEMRAGSWTAANMAASLAHKTIVDLMGAPETDPAANSEAATVVLNAIATAAA